VPGSNEHAGNRVARTAAKSGELSRFNIPTRLADRQNPDLQASPKFTRKRPAKLTMDGQFESRFKNYDESDMNQPLSQWAFSNRRCLENPTTAVSAERSRARVGVEYLSFITKRAPSAEPSASCPPHRLGSCLQGIRRKGDAKDLEACDFRKPLRRVRRYQG
jgi:hypothetical protein